MALDKDNATYGYMKKTNESNLIAPLHFGSTLPWGNTNKQMPAGHPHPLPLRVRQLAWLLS